ncbi:MAG TPA: hypothetical protein VH350_16155 [Candidatus Sulfotelmatobacter sp.]|nr:hypothetical protein [Candidatus Sulfotelmatobacter sp.]
MIMRKVVHVDTDAFYASVEQRDNPDLRGKPVIVAWKGNRSVVCAASYEARAFGVRSAMPAKQAERLRPDATFVAPDFTRYRAVSGDVRAIFKRGMGGAWRDDHPDNIQATHWRCNEEKGSTRMND